MGGSFSILKVGRTIPFAVHVISMRSPTVTLELERPNRMITGKAKPEKKLKCFSSKLY